jgi:hypothetical protein
VRVRFFFFARVAAGAPSIRHSLRPFLEAREFLAKLGRVASREQFWLFENCISTFAVVPASAPGPITTNVFVVRYWSGNPADN